jgi:hypothetical protein
MSTHPTSEAEITKVAEGYLSRPTEDLYDLLTKEWGKVQPESEFPIRGDEDKFWHEVKDRLVAKIVKNQAAVTVTLGYITSQVMNWAQANGIDIDAYRIFIALLVALVAQSVFETLESRTDKNKNTK